MRRALLLVSQTVPAHEAAAVADRTFGWTVGRLMALRQSLFGSKFACTAVCASCGETAELGLDLAAILEESGSPHTEEVPGRLTIEAHGFVLVAQSPNLADLLAVESSTGDRAAALALRSIVAAHRAEEAIEPKDLPVEVWRVVEERLMGADPLADLRLEIACPHCGRCWLEALDIVSVLWNEITALARSLLFEVAAISRSFGWSEAAILSLSPARRRAYLELALR
ncbi:hypothetical protein [Ensifer sp.]|jgi:hypothetical protein|uniref:hypothetical protein n=1 Tax=Ensifer sp. TaxID=1872086 RepID=UPI002E162967|nr:hypothetical protein [Ensifer sp.]